MRFKESRKQLLAAVGHEKVWQYYLTNSAIAQVKKIISPMRYKTAKIQIDDSREILFLYILYFSYILFLSNHKVQIVPNKFQRQG